MILCLARWVMIFFSVGRVMIFCAVISATTSICLTKVMEET